MDYFGMPHVQTYFPPEACFLDIRNARAAIPGSGEDLVAFTYSKDAAEMVALSLDLPAWSEKSPIVGDRKCFRDIVGIVEEVRGMMPIPFCKTIIEANARCKIHGDP